MLKKMKYPLTIPNNFESTNLLSKNDSKTLNSEQKIFIEYKEESIKVNVTKNHSSY